MSAEVPSGGSPPETRRLFLRPPQALMELPLADRWEVTRRHAYYLQFWEAALRARQGTSEDPAQREADNAAALLLEGIGFSELPPPPTASWESLRGGQLSRSWLSGAFHATTYKTVVGVLLTLPPDTRQWVGRLLVHYSLPIADAQAQMHNALTLLTEAAPPELEAELPVPIVAVNLSAPQRVIVQAIGRWVTEQKRRLGRPERRRRADKVADYLAVWDLRAGWKGGRYDRASERTFRAVSRALKISISTALNRYQSAFRLIVGHEYTFETWLLVFGPLKLAGPAAAGNASYPQRRSRQSRRPLEVNSTTLGGGRERDFVGLLAETSSGIGEVELLIDMNGLIASGWDNESILRKLELSPDAIPIIDYLRQRASEG